MTNTEEILNASDIDVGVDELDDSDVMGNLTPELQRWWIDQFGGAIEETGGFFTPPQKEAIPRISQGTNTLVASPTGSGKTLSAYTSVLSDLFTRAKNDELDNSVYCLYVSPLKSLANDIHRNLEAPLEGVQEQLGDETPEVRHAIRHGDTSDTERQKMLDETPHILNTTPETLAILLNSPKFKKKLESVEYVIVDEIHSLAENKRGVHLSVSLERLQEMANNEITRIGCSATVEPLDTIGEFLVGQDDDGNPRDFETVDTRFVRDYDLEVETPVDDLIQTPPEVVTESFYNRIDTLIQQNDTTLVFTNTRSGAESTLENLRGKFSENYDASNSACHHGSLSKEKREAVEKGLKTGEFKVVTTSTSLELGIDMQDIDLVVQVGSPKSISGLLQRVGRAGHSLGDTVTGRVIALDRDELVECAVMTKQAEEGHIDRVFVPERAQDVASQQVYGMAINGPLPKSRVYTILKRAYPYRNYSEDEFNRLLKYLQADYDGLEDKNVYPKIWVDTNDAPDGEHHYEEFDVGEELVGRSGGYQARIIYMTNVGTIPDSFSLNVVTRSDEWVGDLDEEYLNTLEKGDVFVLGGQNYKYKYRRNSKVYVDPTSEPPTVPSWFSERLPLSYDLAQEILEFQQDVVDTLSENGRDGLREYLQGYPVNDNAVSSLTSIYDEQVTFGGLHSVSTPSQLTIEEYVDDEQNERHYFVKSVYGRQFNDGFSRLVANYCTDTTPVNVEVAINDQGFTLTVPKYAELDVEEIIENINPDEIRSDLRATLKDTDFLKRYWRINATRSLMILKVYKGRQKSAKQQQMASEMMLSYAESLDNFPIIEETYRELMEDKLNLKGILEVTEAINNGDIEVTQIETPTPSPRSFSLATLSSSDVVVAEDESEVLKEFHEKVLESTGMASTKNE